MQSTTKGNIVKIINTDGISQGTKVISLGQDVTADMCITDINITLSTGEPVEAQIRCLIPKFSVEVLPENVTFIQDTMFLDEMMTVAETLLMHNMSKEVRQGVENIRYLLKEQLKILEKT